MKSDEAAVSAMEMVITKTGGTAWNQLSSSKEAFSITSKEGDPSRTRYFLDDWSTGATRYRRSTVGRAQPPADHNGVGSFTAQVGGRTIVVPEFDQARTVVNRLPSAAASIMLRNSRYILKISATRSCSGDAVCVDVFEASNSVGIGALSPEQRWVISKSTGLPVSITTSVFVAGSSRVGLAEKVRFLQYAVRDNFVVPSSIEFTGPAAAKSTWSLIKFVSNPGFDTAKFDQEVR